MGKEKRGSKQWSSHSLLQVATLARARATQLHLKRNYTHTHKKKLFANQLNILQDLTNHFQRIQSNLDCIDFHELHSISSSTSP